MILTAGTGATTISQISEEEEQLSISVLLKRTSFPKHTMDQELLYEKMISQR